MPATRMEHERPPNAQKSMQKGLMVLLATLASLVAILLGIVLVTANKHTKLKPRLKARYRSTTFGLEPLYAGYGLPCDSGKLHSSGTAPQ